MSYYRAVLALTLAGSPVFVSGAPRAIVQVVTPDGVVGVVTASSGRWSVPAGTSGSKDNPIVLEAVDAVTLKIGDRINPEWGVGSTAVNGANPQTTFPVTPPRALGVFCVGCNGPRPSITILSWKSLPTNRRAPMVARVSLGVDATDPGAVFNDSNSIMVEVWFIRRGVAENQNPVVEAGPDQLVKEKQAVTLGGVASDPDGDELTFAWSQISGRSVALIHSDKPGGSFVAPSVYGTTHLAFELTVQDGKGGAAADQVQVTVENNHLPVVSPLVDQTVNSLEVVGLTASAHDPDGDSLTYQWSQVSGPPTEIQQADQLSATLIAPMVEVEAELLLELSVSDGVEPVVVSVRFLVKPLRLNSIVLPAGVNTTHQRFQNTFIGVTIANLNPRSNQITVSGRDLSGNEQIGIPFNEPLPAQGQKAFLTREIVGSEAETVAIVARGSSGPIQSSFMVGDFDSRRLDGIGGTLNESKLLYFPIARQLDGDDTTLIFLFNSREPGDPAVALRLYRTDGTLDRETSVPIAGFGSVVGTLDEIFDETLEISEGYVEVESSILLSGVEFLAREESFSAMAAQPGVETRYLLVPHLFVDNHGGGTEIRLLNVGTLQTLLEIWAYDDDSNELGYAEVPIQPKELFVAEARDLLNLVPNGLDQNQIITGHLKFKASAGKLNRYWIQQPGNLVGTVSFSGNGGRFRSSLPMIQEGRKETLLLHVAQSAALRMFTGVSILNAEAIAAQVTVKAFSEQGDQTAEQTFVLEPDHRVVDVLNGATFFGSGFEQVKGHLKILSDQPVVVFALFGDFDSRFLSAIEGQAPIR